MTWRLLAAMLCWILASGTLEASDSAGARTTPPQRIEISPPPSGLPDDDGEDASPLYSDITLPPELVYPVGVEGVPEQEIAALLGTAQANRQDYLDVLEEQRPFSGLYAYGQHQQRRDDHDSSTVIGLEWELFEEGWHESARELRKKKVESELQYLQSLVDMEARQLQEQLYRIKAIGNRVRWYIADKRLAYLEKLRHNRGRQLAAGYITLDDYQEIDFKLEREALRNEYLENQPLARLEQPQWRLLNDLEELRPVDSELLIEDAWARAASLDIQDNFVERAEFFPAWSDNLSLSLYAERREEWNNEEDNLLGVRIRVPLTTNQQRDRLIGLEQQAYRNQKQAIRIRIAERIGSLVQEIGFHIKNLRIHIRQHRLLARQLQNSQGRGEYSIQSLPYTPQRRVEELSQQLLDKEGEILDTRIQVLELLVQLNAFVGRAVLADLLIAADLPDAPPKTPGAPAAATP